MNDTITKIVALLFEDLEETDETVALHDEILQNCQERYADLTAGGMTADEATKAVIDSLNGMQEMLADYPRKNARPAAPQAPVSPMGSDKEPEEEKADEEQATADSEERTELYTGIHRAELRLGSADLQILRSPDEAVRLTLRDPNHVLKAHTEGDRLIVERQANGAKPASSRHIKMDSGFKWNGNLNQLMNSVSKMISGISKELGSMGFSSGEEVTLEIPDGLFLQAETSSGDALLEGLTQMAEEEYNKDSLLRNLFVSGQAAKLAPLFVQELEKALDALADPDSELRRQIDNWLLARMEDYRHDIAFADWLNSKLSQLATAKALAFKELLQTQDVDMLLTLLQKRLQLLADSETEQSRLDGALKELLLQALAMQHDTVYDLVLAKLHSYDRDELIAKMEQRVGDDLQNIRKSGTCIGGLMGAVLFIIATMAERLVG